MAGLMAMTLRRRRDAPWCLAAMLVAAVGCAPPAGSWTEPISGMTFVLVPAGAFTMGSDGTAEELPHRVTLSHSFYLGTHEVTQAEWRAVTGKSPSHFADCGPTCPVENVNWHDVQDFLERLQALSGTAFRLPTEAEWEHACRAGTTTPFNTGENLTTNQANYHGQFPIAGAPGVFRGTPTPVGSFAPNAFGLFDMHGNVWEWTASEHCPYAAADVTDPTPACGAALKSIRGGSWLFNADSARCAARYTHAPKDLGMSLGFRVARDVR